MSLLNLFTSDEKIPIIDDNSKEDLCFMKHGPIKFYWNNCSEVYNKKGDQTFDSWDDIKYLDFKVTKNMFDFEESYSCLDQFVNNKQNKKLLHIVNTHHDNKSLFDLLEWYLLVERLNKYNLSTIVIEVVNKCFSDEQSYDTGVEKCKQILNPARIDYFLFTNSNNFIYDNKKYVDHGRLI